MRKKQPEDPEAAQSEAGAAQKQPNAARGSQEQPRAAQSSPEQPRNSPKQQQQTRSNPEAPEAAHFSKFLNLRFSFFQSKYMYGSKKPEKTLSARAPGHYRKQHPRSATALAEGRLRGRVLLTTAAV